jgi:hypothetical protein
MSGLLLNPLAPLAGRVSELHRFHGSERSPTASSIALAVRGASGMVTTAVR